MNTPAVPGAERRAPRPWLAALRALLAGGALLILTAIRRAPIPRDGRTWTLIVVLGIVNVAIAYAAMFGGTIGLTTGVASVLANIQPVLILLPAWWLYHERPTLRSVAAMLAGLAGLLLIVLPTGAGTGAWLSLTSAAAVTAGTLISRAVHADPFLVAAA
ncbi:EamA family transporter [Microbacterium lacticum]